MASLLESMAWSHHPLAAGAAEGTLKIAVGQVGTGKPTALITAGIHGDEGPWGAWAIRHLLMTTSADDLIGTLRVVPVANPLAMAADARNAPLDTLDLNRNFPGDLNGSHTERLAALLVEHAVIGSEVCIDLHGGGSWCVNAFVFQMPGGEALSQAFDAPFVAQAPERTVTLTGYARSQGAVCTAVEMGGRCEAEDDWARRIAAGLRRALIRAGVLRGEDTPLPTVSIPVGKTTVLRPSRGGVFIPQLRAAQVGTIVAGGTLLGELIDPATGQVIETFTAPFERTALMLLRPMLTRIEGGAMTYVVAEPVS